MTVFELISVHRPLLQKLHSNGIKISDYKYIELYEKYLEMLKNGEKVTYIVTNLSGYFDVCERTVYNMIELFSTVVM